MRDGEKKGARHRAAYMHTDTLITGNNQIVRNYNDKMINMISCIKLHNTAIESILKFSIHIGHRSPRVQGVACFALCPACI